MPRRNRRPPNPPQRDLVVVPGVLVNGRAFAYPRPCELCRRQANLYEPEVACLRHGRGA